jgi:flagellar hook-length control protein FliK
MEHLGQTNISIKMQENNLNLSFVMNNQESFLLLDSHLEKLNQSLTNKGFLVHSQVTVEEETQVDFIDDFLSQGENKPEVKHYSFDMRV